MAANATSAPDRSCVVSYTVRHAWSTGYSAEIAVRNTGDERVDRSEVDWTLGPRQTVVNGWSGSWSGSDGKVTVRGRSLDRGDTLTLRFTGYHPEGEAPRPSGFALNGARCETHESAAESAAPTPSAMALPPGASASLAPHPNPSHAAVALGPLFVDPQGQVVEWVAQNGGDARAATIRDRIATKPQARWFANTGGDITAQVRDYTARAAGAGKVPVLVPYAIPHRDCGGASQGGAGSADAYRTFARGFAQGLGTGPAIVVLEPDAIPHLTDCLSADQQEERLGLLGYAAQQIKAANPKARVYYDSGHSRWLDATEIADRLQRAGATRYGDGIALNTSNYNATADEVAYGKKVLAALGVARLQMVVDTSRNGAGPAAGNEWCDPAGRRLGRAPTTSTGDARVAAFLWVKRPGESDGCSGAAGQFIPGTAFDLSS